MGPSTDEPDISTTTPNSVQGAKRRKQQKTSRVTPQQQSQANLDSEHETNGRNKEVSITSTPPMQPPPLPAMLMSMPPPTGLSDSPPPPIPIPCISTTTVVTRNGDQNYKCPLCKDDLASQNEFTQHIRAHNEVKPFPDPTDPTGQAKVYYCCLCSKMLSSFSSLDRHMLVHSGERPFSCELCGQTFTTNGNMHRHKRTHSAKELADHNEAMGGAGNSTKRGGRKRKTPVTTNGTNGSPAKNGKAKASATETPAEPGEKLPDLGPRCPLCNDAFFSDNLLESHLLASHDGEQLNCDECSFSFPNYSTFKLHKMFHTTACAPGTAGGMPPVPCTTAAAAAALQQQITNITSSIGIAQHHSFSPHQFPSHLVKAFAEQGELLTNGKPACAFTPPEPQPIVTVAATATTTPSYAAASSSGSGKRKKNSLNNNLSDSLVIAPLNTANGALLSQLKSIKQNTHPTIPSNKALREMEREAEAALARSHRATSSPIRVSEEDKDEDEIVAEVTFDDDDDMDDAIAEDRKRRDRAGGDLADVESILSVTRASGMNGGDSINGSGSLRVGDNDLTSETSSALDALGNHDDGDPLIRDMKLKGEFPCRLCPAVYPNLRALKGHNKEHLGKAPYECNVGTCNYNSGDKSTLTRHMRTHTGEKPFECRLCSYGFTTKANCERHLKNKHGKTNREQIRDCLVIHESDEPEPNPLQKLQLEASKQAGNFRCKVCKELFLTADKVKEHAIEEHPSYSNDVDHIFEELRGRSLASLGELGAGPSMVPRTSNVPSLSQLRPLLPSQIRKNQLEDAQSCSSEDMSHSDEAPLDLSRPARTPDPEDEDEEKEEKNIILPQAPPQLLPPGMMQLPQGMDPAAAELLKNSLAMGLLMAANPHTMGGAGRPHIPGMPNFQLPFPFSLPMPSFSGLGDVNRMQLQQQLQQQQQQAMLAAMTGGASMAALGDVLKQQQQQQHLAPPQPQLVDAAALLDPSSSSLPSPIGPSDATAVAFLTAQDAMRKQQQLEQQQQQKAAAALSVVSLSDDASEEKEAAEALKSLKNIGRAQMAETNNGMYVEGGFSENDNSADMDKGSPSDDEANFKMVIKNGVLMRKQKQRRYRTERPYGCDHCNARFTLRSNMERHVKQQHPQHWSSKPRGSRKNHSATAPILSPKYRHMINEDEGEVIEIASDGSNDVDMIESEEEGEQRTLIIDDGANDNDADLASVDKLINNANCNNLLINPNEAADDADEEEEDDEEDDHRDLFSDEGGVTTERKKSAYSAAPHKISCQFCGRKFPWSSSLNRHILTHTGDKPFKCTDCPLEFTTKSNCDRHQVRKHGHQAPIKPTNGLPERPFKCQLCPSSFFSAEKNLRKHQYAKHFNMEFPSEDNAEDDGSYEDEEKENSSREGELEAKADNENLLICHVCEEAFHERKEVLTHLETTHPDIFESLSKRGLVEKALTLGDEEAKEEENNKSPVTLNAIRKVSCLFCSESFSSSQVFRNHVQYHVGSSNSAAAAAAAANEKKPFSCGVCHKRFTLKQSLIRHTKKHEEMGVVVSGDAPAEEADTHAQKENVNMPTRQLRGKAAAVAAVEASDAASKRTTKRPSLMDTIAKLSSAKKQCNN